MKPWPVALGAFLLATVHTRAHADTSACEAELAPKLGQMFYVWVPNLGKDLPPAYAELIRKVRPGGTLIAQPGVSTQTIQDLAASVAAVRKLYEGSDTDLPLIGADYIQLKPSASGPERGAWFGRAATNLGFGTRISGDDFSDGSDLSRICRKLIAQVKSIAHRIVGINHPLGPGVDQILSKTDPQLSSRVLGTQDTIGPLLETGLVPTLKHYPFTVKGLNLHKYTATLPLSDAQLNELDRTFFPKATDDYVVMTTHVAIEGFDGGELATYSKAWGDRLRKKIGEQRLIMTDGLFMLGNYHEKLAAISGLPQETIDTYFQTRRYGDDEKLLAPWNYAYAHTEAQAKCMEYGRQLLHRTLGRNLLQNYTESRKLVAEWLTPGVDPGPIDGFNKYYEAVEKKTGCNLRELEGFAEMQNGSFTLEEAKQVALTVMSGAARQAILAGNDLILAEGGPKPIQETFAALLKEACSGNAELASRIEESSRRIHDFKQRNEAKLSTRTSTQWFKENQAILEPLLFKIFPELVNPKRRCSKIDEAMELLKRLSPLPECGR